jgi:hypothetical protein
MYDMAVDLNHYFKTIVGFDDLKPLIEAGINSIPDYVKTESARLVKITGQRKDEVKRRQLAAKIYLRCGLEPGLCLRLISAGAHNACEVLSLDIAGLELDEWEENCLLIAKVNIAFENIRGFLTMKKIAGKAAVLREINNLGTKEKIAAVKSVEIICGLPPFRWLRTKFNRMGGIAMEPVKLVEIVTAIPADEVRSIIEKLKTQYLEEL